MDKLYFARKNENAILPSKDLENGGYDVYANQEIDNISIEPLETKLVPTGIYTAFSSDYCLIAKERGSTGIRAMSVKAGVIDSGYRGEIFIAINNTGSKTLVISDKPSIIETPDTIFYPKSKAIAQLVLIVLAPVSSEEIPLQDLLKIESKRKDTKLGQSGK